MIVQFTKQSLKQLKKLDNNLSGKIIHSLDGFSKDKPTDYKKLKGFPNRYRIRVRDYRAIFDVIIHDNVMYVLRVAHRREVYKGIERL